MDVIFHVPNVPPQNVAMNAGISVLNKSLAYFIVK